MDTVRPIIMGCVIVIKQRDCGLGAQSLLINQDHYSHGPEPIMKLQISTKYKHLNNKYAAKGKSQYSFIA